jgi:hypothetical protein
MLEGGGCWALEMTKGRVVSEAGFVRGKENCRSLGFARDDKGEG